MGRRAVEEIKYWGRGIRFGAGGVRFGAEGLGLGRGVRFGILIYETYFVSVCFVCMFRFLSIFRLLYIMNIVIT